MSDSKSTTSICEMIPAAALAPQTGNCFLLDVRSPIEFECEHIEGAVNIPLDQLDKRLAEVPRQGEIVVICRSGKRAERGAYSLLGQGLKPKVLTGGMMAWRQAGMPIKEGKKMISIERQIQLVVGPMVLTGVALGVFVNPWFLVIPAFFGAGLTFAGATGICALGLVLMKAPWNQLPGTENKNECNTKSGCCG